jgi:hypothetical protein
MKDPKLIALLFNECINNQDIEGLINLMTADHIFIDRDGNISKDMNNGWKRFFKECPTYKNFFTRIDSRGNIVIILGYAIWSNESLEEDHSIWTAKIRDNLVAEWIIYHDTEENRKKFNLVIL